MTERVHNFGAGPAVLPREVLEEIRAELLDFRGSGMSILEVSHRSTWYEEVHGRAIADLRRLLGGAPDHEFLFMGGGARTQFSAVPMNLLAGGRADYIVTGLWSEKALAAALRVGAAREIWSSAASSFDQVPRPEALVLEPDAAYLHYTSNNTIYGTQFHALPDPGNVPLVADMSSDVLSRPIDLPVHGLIYASAQKNLGPAGVTLVVVRRDLLERSGEGLPDMLSYARLAASNSLLNTPPVFPIYVVGLVAKWLLSRGGLEAVAVANREKADLLYGVIDASDGFYRGHAAADSRSRMNVTFRLASEGLEREFLEGAARRGLVGLAGHRSVGGIRASIYNAIERASVELLAEHMLRFREERG